MVRLKGPLFSMDASGTIGKAVVFSKWKGRPYARRWVIPSNPKSGLQVGLRQVLKFLSQDYTNLAAGDISDWEGEAEADNITALNAQIADGVERARRNLGWRENLTDADPGAVDDPINGAATAQPKTLVLTWDDPAANAPDYCWAIYASTTSGFTPDISNLVGVTKHDVETFTHTNLTSGTTVYYRIRGLSTSGFLGDLCTEFSGTPD